VTLFRFIPIFLILSTLPWVPESWADADKCAKQAVVCTASVSGIPAPKGAIDVESVKKIICGNPDYIKKVKGLKRGPTLAALAKCMGDAQCSLTPDAYQEAGANFQTAQSIANGCSH
jgi:hypothetical protein